MQNYFITSPFRVISVAFREIYTKQRAENTLYKSRLFQVQYNKHLFTTDRQGVSKQALFFAYSIIKCREKDSEFWKEKLPFRWDVSGSRSVLAAAEVPSHHRLHHLHHRLHHRLHHSLHHTHIQHLHLLYTTVITAFILYSVCLHCQQQLHAWLEDHEESSVHCWFFHTKEC